ncbi:MAG: GspE/PulE/PilB domain-containing protein [Deltaproteobacteria bacterium]
MAMRLGEMLVKAEAISEKQLQAGLAEQQRWGGLIGEILVRMEYVAEETLILALSRQLGIPKAEQPLLDAPDERAVRKLTHEVARNLRAVPLALQDGGKVLVVAMAEPQNLAQLDELRKVTGCKLAPRLIGSKALNRAQSRAFGGAESAVEDDGEGFKMVDSQGRTLIKSIDQVRAEAAPPPVAEAPRPPPLRPPPPARPAPAPVAAGGDDPRALLQRLEEAQRKEVAALRAMVEILIERGVFTRDEYLARIRR